MNERPQRTTEERIVALELAVFGRDDLNMPGLLTLATTINEKMNTLLAERSREKSILTGISIGLGLTSLTGIANIVIVVAKALGG